METANKKRVEVLLDPARVNRMSLPALVILTVALVALYALVCYLRIGHVFLYPQIGARSRLLLVVLVLLLYLVLVVAHEVIHVLAFLLVGKSKAKLGFLRKHMMPYAHAFSPMPVAAYRWALVLPTLLLGLLPILAGLVWLDFFLYIMGILMTASGIGDGAVLWMLRGYPKDTLVMDHDSLPGCVVYLEPADQKED